MAGLSDIFGGVGSAAGAGIGQMLTEDEKQQVLQYLQQNYRDTQGLDPSKLGSTAFSGISTDPALRAAQMDALHSMSGLANQDGLDPQAKAMQAEANQEAAGFEQQRANAVQQNLRARGMGGGGSEVAGLIAAQQGGANRSHAGSLQAASDARNRALAATQAEGALGGSIRGQDFSEAAAKAQAQDQARNNAYGGQVQKVGMGNQARGGLANYYAADRAATIGQMASAGQAGGSILGVGGDIGLGAATGTGIGGALAGKTPQPAAPTAKDNSLNPWGNW